MPSGSYKPAWRSWRPQPPSLRPTLSKVKNRKNICYFSFTWVNNNRVIKYLKDDSDDVVEGCVHECFYCFLPWLWVKPEGRKAGDGVGVRRHGMAHERTRHSQPSRNRRFRPTDKGFWLFLFHKRENRSDKRSGASPIFNFQFSIYKDVSFSSRVKELVNRVSISDAKMQPISKRQKSNIFEKLNRPNRSHLSNYDSAK